MAIISQETWNNMSKEEKEKICKEYMGWQEEAETNPYFEGKISNMEDLFGKENLQSKPKERKYFLRFGDLPENGKSSIYKADEKIGDEKGISVFECTQDTFQLILPQELTRSLMSDVQGFFNYCNRPLYLVSGIQIGTGNDNEPIITDAKIERELPYNKENLQHKFKIRTWKDVEESYTHIDIELDKATKSLYDYSHCSIQLLRKCIATLKISKLIELAYGGMVSKEEWANKELCKWYIVIGIDGKLHIDSSFENWQEFISFHTKQQAEEFMSYPENNELIRQYYMMV